jgi:hypothetical protein
LERRHEVLVVDTAKDFLEEISDAWCFEDRGRGGEVGEGEWIEGEIFGAVATEGGDCTCCVFGAGAGAENICVGGRTFADESCACWEFCKRGEEEDIGGVDRWVDARGCAGR